MNPTWFVKGAERWDQIHNALGEPTTRDDLVDIPDAETTRGAFQLLNQAMSNEIWKQVCPPTIVEFATRDDSEIQRACRRLQCSNKAMTQRGPDLSRQQGRMWSKELIENIPGCHLWGTAPTSTWTDAEPMDNSMVKRRLRARAMLRTFSECAESAGSGGGTISLLLSRKRSSRWMPESSR